MNSVSLAKSAANQKQILPPSGNASRDVVVTTSIRSLTKFRATVRCEADEDTSDEILANPPHGLIAGDLIRIRVEI